MQFGFTLKPEHTIERTLALTRQAEAASSEAVLAELSTMASELRTRLGESLPDLVTNTAGNSNLTAYDITADAAYIASQARSAKSASPSYALSPSTMRVR